MSDPSHCYQAAWVFPVAAPPIRDGLVEVRGDTIVAVKRPDGGSDAPITNVNERLGGPAAILPGLVNAHTHLEFSGLAEPLGAPARPLTEWIPQVIRWRSERDEADDGLARKTAAVQQGLAESLAAGVAHVGEIATPPWSAAMHRSRGPRCTAFLELIALGPHDNEAARQAAFTHLNDSKSPESGWVERGLSPHAPYTVNLELLEDAIDLSERTGAPLQMHLAETVEELELIATASGPFREMLERVGAWERADLPVGKKPLDYLERLAKASRCVVAHGNYLDSSEIRFLGEHVDRMSVVFCPRTHAYFAHAPYPLREMLDAGVNVAIGTDSRASNPSLSVFAEMKHVAEKNLAAPDEILRMGTAAGATALGATNRGVLQYGRRADLTILRVARNDDPYQALFASESETRALLLNGEWCAES